MISRGSPGGFLEQVIRFYYHVKNGARGMNPKGEESFFLPDRTFLPATGILDVVWYHSFYIEQFNIREEQQREELSC